MLGFENSILIVVLKFSIEDSFDYEIYIKVFFLLAKFNFWIFLIGEFLLLNVLI